MPTFMDSKVYVKYLVDQNVSNMEEPTDELIFNQSYFKWLIHDWNLDRKTRITNATPTTSICF